MSRICPKYQLGRRRQGWSVGRSILFFLEDLSCAWHILHVVGRRKTPYLRQAGQWRRRDYYDCKINYICAECSSIGSLSSSTSPILPACLPATLRPCWNTHTILPLLVGVSQKGPPITGDFSMGNTNIIGAGGLRRKQLRGVVLL